ncbi:spindle assembly checkpoint kinase, putative [Entamoeba invadens IP1]|uniref:spindle assembly checkpoint kinase, putative n=1 Tax=Entamoeba invadens IP1 TaxID=370355 RepID=UPI0002C3DD75|nr:spindle assembly checkpoint kinase, putative [Entamoeba invadens IP1]ELP94079.1 spindle assembly checkpoint kinase, putative [Entamoeba invadens IP1]|eukprot:XP_004260850.1 spindle assembly checkpoint kinase, putative [Entamoeba invadens IP1]
MSLSKELRTSSISSTQVKFPFDLEPPMTKLSFGQYAVQGVPLSQTVTFHNKTNDAYRMTILVSTSSKYILEVDEEKLNIKKQSRKSVVITVCFNTVSVAGLTGEVTFQLKKKALIGNETSVLTLRFHMVGVIPIIHTKDVIYAEDPKPPKVVQDTIVRKIIITDAKKNKERVPTMNPTELHTLTSGLSDCIKVGDAKGRFATYKGSGKVFVFKFDPEESFVTSDDIKRILDNYTIIHHTTVVQMVGVNYERSLLVLEADTQFSLDQVLDRSLPPFFIGRCCVNLVTALQYLSSEGIIHRNVKPHKLRLCKSASMGGVGNSLFVKLHDFSCAVQVKEGELIRDFVGTLEYMAPEVIKGDGYSLQVDTFSLGMTMYHLFSCKKPYEEMSQLQIKEFVTSGKRLTLPENVPLQIVALINKCWAQDPEKRPDYKFILNSLNEFGRSTPCV